MWQLASGFAGIFGAAALGAGITESLSGHHRVLTYALWYGLAGLFFVLMIVFDRLRRSRAQAAVPDDQPATFNIGHLGSGVFRQSRGRVLNAGRVDNLQADDSTGPDVQETPQIERRRGFRFWLRSRD